MKKMREWTAAGPVIHAESSDGLDMTLCGYAYEGENGDDPLAVTTQGKIDCHRCVRIIRFCKAIDSRQLDPTV